MADPDTVTADPVVLEATHETDAATLPAVVEHPGPVVTFNEQQVALLKATVCNPGTDKQGRQLEATDAELDLFMAVCRRTGLDPFAKQIYAVFRWNKDLGRKAMQIQTSIDGFRVIAERKPDYAGQDGPYWCGPDGQWTDVWLSEEHPHAAKVGVLRQKFSAPLYSVAKWSEFAQTDQQGKPSGLWPTMPTIMLAKCAEAQALRRAFPNDLSGLYTAEEMAQADNPGRTAEPPTPAAPKPDEKLTAKGVAQIRAACTDLGFSEDDITDMVEIGTGGRTSVLEEVTYGERPALAKAKQHIVDRKAATATCACPPAGDTDAYEAGIGDLCPVHGRAVPEWLVFFGGIAEKVREKVDPADKTKVTGRERTKVILRLKDLDVQSSDDQRLALATVLGRPIHSRSDLTASEAAAVVAVLDEEGADAQPLTRAEYESALDAAYAEQDEGDR